MLITPDEQELYLLHASRINFSVFSRVVSGKLQMPGYLRVYYDALDKFARGEIRRMIVQMPPQHGKSQGSSRFLPAFLLGTNPDLKIVICSYSQIVARSFNRDVQRIMEGVKYRLIFPKTKKGSSRDYSASADLTEVQGREGYLYVVGRGGSLTSKSVDVAILDDLYKDAAEANSPVIRESAWQWYTSVLRTREHNKSRELIVFTRWHKDDIIGLLESSGEKIKDVERMSDLAPFDGWLRLNFEAIKESEPTEIDPRPSGAPLWPDRHSLEELTKIRKLDPLRFEALFQGHPVSAAGLLYGNFKTYVNAADFGDYVRTGCYVDVADGGGDYLCAIAYDIYKAGEVWNSARGKMEANLFALVKDIEYTQEGTAVTIETVASLINRNGVRKAFVESNNGGGQFARSLEKRVRCVVETFTQRANKESRILTSAGEVNGAIIFPLGWESRWPRVYEHLSGFLRNFKANEHDDLPDTITGIFEKELSEGDATPYHKKNKGMKVLA